MQKISDKFNTPAWHWMLHAPENRRLSKRGRNVAYEIVKSALRWDVSVPQGFSLCGRLPYINCTSMTLRKQERRLASIKPEAVGKRTTWNALADGFNAPYAIRANLLTRRRLKFWMLLTDGVRPLAYAQRSVSFDKASIDHEYLAFEKSVQNQGHGAKVLANALAVYPLMGISKITLTAGLSAGSAVWPRLGFSPVSLPEWSKLRIVISRNLASLDPNVAQAFQNVHGRNLEVAVQAVLASDKPSAIFELVDVDPGSAAAKAAGLRHGIAGELLSGGHWRGQLEINGAGGRRLQRYLQSKNVAIPMLPA